MGEISDKADFGEREMNKGLATISESGKKEPINPTSPVPPYLSGYLTTTEAYVTNS